MLIQLEQGTPEWHIWRKDKIGASDSSAIQNISPWLSAYEFWLLKTGRVKPKEASQAMLRGNLREEEGRSAYETLTQIPMFPACAIHDEYEWMSASLDGLSMCEKKGLEIKWPNKKVMELAKQGEAPPHYFCQMQHQMAVVPTIESVDYFCCSDDEKILITVDRDEEYIENLITTLKDFYENHLVADIPPEMTEQDCLVIEDDPEFTQAARNWLAAKRAKEIAFEDENEARKTLLNLTDDGNVRGAGICIKKYYVESYDYKKCCESLNVDLSDYKKEISVRWRITEEK